MKLIYNIPHKRRIRRKDIVNLSSIQPVREGVKTNKKLHKKG